MLDMNLSWRQYQDYHSLLVTHHQVSFQVQVMNLAHQYVSYLSNKLVDGQVTVDADQEITRSATLDILDPYSNLVLDTRSPDEGAVFADRMVRVYRTITDPLGRTTYSCPVFTGPISKVTRNGALIAIEAQGKESLGMTSPWVPRTFPKYTRYTDVIWNILVNLMGESRQRVIVPRLDARLSQPLTIGSDTTYWAEAKRLARRIGWQLFYDARGICQMRYIPRRATFRFKDKANGSILTPPTVGFSLDGVNNAVEVAGKKPQTNDNTKQPWARRVAPRNHPLSPYQLGRNGVWRYLPLRITDDSITNNRQAAERAQHELEIALLQGVSVSFDSLPIPHLQELDVCQVWTGEMYNVFSLGSFTIPLNSSGVSSIGYVKNVKVKSRGRRKLTGKR